MILDTNAFSALAEGESALAAILGKAAVIALPVIVVGEYRYGISQSRHRLQHEQWLNESLGKFKILAVDDGTTIPYSAIRAELKRAGRPIPSNDIWIAALCRQHFLPLLSRDRHFDAVAGIIRLAW